MMRKAKVMPAADVSDDESGLADTVGVLSGHWDTCPTCGQEIVVAGPHRLGGQQMSDDCAELVRKLHGYSLPEEVDMSEIYAAADAIEALVAQRYSSTILREASEKYTVMEQRAEAAEALAEQWQMDYAKQVARVRELGGNDE